MIHGCGVLSNPEPEIEKQCARCPSEHKGSAEFEAFRERRFKPDDARCAKGSHVGSHDNARVRPFRDKVELRQQRPVTQLSHGSLRCCNGNR